MIVIAKFFGRGIRYVCKKKCFSAKLEEAKKFATTSLAVSFHRKNPNLDVFIIYYTKYRGVWVVRRIKPL